MDEDICFLYKNSVALELRSVKQQLPYLDSLDIQADMAIRIGSSQWSLLLLS